MIIVGFKDNLMCGLAMNSVDKLAQSNPRIADEIMTDLMNDDIRK